MRIASSSNLRRELEENRSDDR